MEEQKKVMTMFRRGWNIFLTGAGGTGKTTLIRKMFQDAMDRKKRIRVTAMTGCAAVLLKCQARTVHSFAGIGLGTGDPDEIVRRVKSNYLKSREWKAVQILIIDEVSMMSRKLLEILDRLAREIRNDSRPFGGIQVVFSGDFYQIRPVGNMADPLTSQFCFESPVWIKLFTREQHIVLTRVYRQKDPLYTQILCQIRDGNLDRESEDILKGLIDKQPEQDSIIRPIQLLPTRRQVDAVNSTELERLDPQTEKIFSMKMTCPLEKDAYQKELDYLKKNLLCDEELRLRKGAQVMCIVNMNVGDQFLCNGSQGTIQGFSSAGNPIVLFKNGIEIEMKEHEWHSEVYPMVKIEQVPLVLAWAVTIHKAQGSTLECAQIDVGRSVFECGQVYVALSRIKNLDGLFLKSFHPRSIMADPKVKAFYENIKSS